MQASVLLALVFSADAVCLAAPPRPVVVIPGVLGSRLCEGEALLWGGRASYLNFPRLALPLDPDRTTIRPCGIIDEVKVLGPLSIDQYEPLLEHLRSLGYREGRTLFVFPYDWRRSNFDAAEELAGFVARTPALRQGKFDIVAHSMGGIVARIYLDRHSGHERVASLITLGTPYRGSLKIVEMLHSGLGGLGNFLAGGSDEVRRVAFTFPSAFELLPSYENCCIRGLPGEPREVFDIYDEEHWFRAWVPPEYRTGSWRLRLRSSLARARELRRLLESPVPSPVEVFPFSGDFIDTLSQVYVDRESLLPEKWNTMRGDGTVVVASAAGGRVAQARVSFSQHAAIFRDGHVKTALERILIQPGGPVDFAGGTASIYVEAGPEATLIPLDGVALGIEPSYVEPGCQVTLRLELRALPDQPVREVRVEGWLMDEAGGRTPFALAEEPERRRGVDDPAAYFKADVRATSPGTYRVVVRVPGLDKDLEEFFVVVPPPEEMQ